MKKLKVGWVGAGFVGQAAHLERFSKFENVDIVGLAELRPDLRNKVLKSYDIKRGFNNHSDLLKELECDAVVAVVNRRNTHQIAKDILTAKKHLLTEKPMAPTYKQAKELVDIAKKNSLIYSVGFMRRYDDAVIKAKNILENYRKNNNLGDILYVKIYVEAGNDYCGIFQRIDTREKRLKPPPISIAPEWLDKDLHTEYEKFVNICSHDINLITYFFNEKCEVKHVDFRKNGYSVAILDFGKFPGALEWVYRPSNIDGWKEGVEIKFEGGEIKLDLPPAFLQNVSGCVSVRFDDINEHKQVNKTIIQGNYTWSFENSDKAFVNATLDGKQSLHSGAEIIKDFDIIDNIWKLIASY